MKKLIFIIGLLRLCLTAEGQKFGIGAVSDTGFVRVLSNGRTTALTATQMASLFGGGTIADNSVTFAKMQDIPTDRLIGRDAAGTGDPAEISVTGNIEFTGSNSIQRGALTGDVTASAGSGATTIANLAVTNAKINDVSVAKLTSGTLPSSFAFGTTSSSTVRTNYSGGNPSWITSNVANETSIFGQDGEQFLTVNNTSATIGSGTSKVEFTDGVLALFDSDATNKVSIQTPATGTLTADYTLTLPVNDGTANQVLTTNGTGTLSWTTPSGGGPSVVSFSQFTSDQDNLNTSGIATATVIKVSGDNGVRAITSISSSGMANGHTFKIVNTGNFTLVLQAQHPDGSVGNRFLNAEDVPLFAKTYVNVVYDSGAQGFFIDLSSPRPYNKSIFIDSYAGSSVAGDWGNFANASSGGSVTSGTPTSDFPASWQLSTLTASTNSAGVHNSKSGSTGIISYGDSYMKCSSILRLNNLSSSGERYEIVAGFANGTTLYTSSSLRSAGITYKEGLNGDRFAGFTVDGSTLNLVDLGISPSVNTLYQLDVYINKQTSEVRFFIDGVYVGRSTANIPSSGIAAHAVCLTKSTGSSARVVNVSKMSTHLYLE